MLSHALTIVANELEKHLTDTYGAAAVTPQVRLGNLSEGVGGAANTGSVARDVLVFSIVNVSEEKALKNISNQTRNDVTLKVTYENPPVFLNLYMLIAATHSNYTNALLVLSRAIRYFQFRNSFDQISVAPASLTTNAPSNVLDQLDTFKLLFELYSPSMEEVNHMWGTLGGKQYPFVMYKIRPLELRFRSPQSEGGLILTVENKLRVKPPVTP